MPTVGDLLAGRYRVDARLGAGGMATVWRAHDVRLGRDVAVKVLLPNLAGDAAMATRFDHEARTLAALSDPRVVAVFDVVDGDPTTGREPFLVMELCPDGSLGGLLDEAGTLPEAALVPLATDAAEGLAALHANGIVHRDVTPRNILLSGTRAKVGDLGLARGAGSQSGEAAGPGAPGGLAELTPPGVTMGTLAYLAPEILGGRSAGPAADVYGLGAVIYRALAGIPPRDAGPAHLARRSPVELRELAPAVSPELDAIVMAALDRDPSARPSAAVLAGRLRALQATGGRMWGSPSLVPAGGSRATTQVAPTHVARPAAREPEATTPGATHVPSPAGRADARSRGDRRPDSNPRPRTPPPGPSYRGPGLWSGELLLALIIGVVVFAMVAFVFAR